MNFDSECPSYTALSASCLGSGPLFLSEKWLGLKKSKFRFNLFIDRETLDKSLACPRAACLPLRTGAEPVRTTAPHVLGRSSKVRYPMRCWGSAVSDKKRSCQHSQGCVRTAQRYVKILILGLHCNLLNQDFQSWGPGNVCSWFCVAA